MCTENLICKVLLITDVTRKISV